MTSAGFYTALVSQGHRRHFNAWFREHQIRAKLSSTPEVIIVVGQDQRHARRLAGMLHLVRVASGEISADERISLQVMIKPRTSLINSPLKLKTTSSKRPKHRS